MAARRVHPLAGLSLGSALLGSALLGAACDRTAGEAHDYVALVGQADPAACLRLEDPLLAQECQAFAAWELARAGNEDAAFAACSGIAGGLWRDECFFQMSDAIAAQGDRARRLCDEAGRYQGHCIGHALGRESQAILEASAIGEEQTAFAAVEAVAVAWVGPQKGRTRAEGILRKSLAARFPDGSLFDRARCGTAPERLCRDAYVQLVIERSGMDGSPPAAGVDPRLRSAVVGEVCTAGPSLETVTAAGLPGWTPDSEALVVDAWQQLCSGRRGKAGRIVPGQAPVAPGQGAPPDPAGAP